ncbi:MAG: beta strand repeat-containing protein [Tepidisphaeraceae bacterium]
MQRAKFGKGMFYRKTALGLAAALTAPALGASATWSGAGGDGAWSNPANWSGGSSPGSTSGTTNTDTATFASGGTGVLPVVVDAGRNLQSILFTGTDAYIIGTTGGNALVMTGTSNFAQPTVQINAGAAAAEVVNAPILLSSAGNAVFGNYAAAAGNTLTIGGSVSASSAFSGSLYLVGTNTGANVVSGNLTNGAGLIGVQKLTAGTWNLTGTNNFGSTSNAAGFTVVDGGTLGIGGNTTAGATYVGYSGTGNGALSVSAGGSYNTGAGVTWLGNTSGAKGVLNVAAGGSYTSAQLALGINANTAGVVNQAGGTVTQTTQTGVFAFCLGAFANSYGNYNLSGGTTGGSEMSIGTSGAGLLNISGTGSLQAISYFNIGRASGSAGVANVSGGTLVSPKTSNITVGYDPGNVLAVLNVSGTGTVDASGHALSIGTGTANLNGGTILADSVLKVNADNNARFNFNGGTLKANADNATFFQNLTSAYVNAGGATVDSNAHNITINQALLAPTGNGVSALAVTGGSGYVGAPLVKITGDGVGATAVANIDATGNLVGITMTNPGVGYTTATYTLIGGGGTGATPGVATLAANTSGGFTKLGAGTLTLGGANTYTGETRISAGTLALSTTGSINNSADVNVAGGATFDTSSKAGGYVVNGLKGAGTVAGAAGQAVTVNNLLAPGDGGVGTLTVSAGNMSLVTGSAYLYDIGGTTAATTSDLVNLTGAGSTLTLNGSYTLNLADLGSVDPTGKTFVLFDYVGSDPATAGTWAINYGTTGWQGGSVSVDSANSRVILSGLTTVPEPTALGALAMGAAALASRRRRKNAAN